MAKTELKTKENEASVEDFIDSIDDEVKRDDARKIGKLMQKATNSEAKMWGANIIGFGSRLLKYESGRELDWLEIGFSPHKANLVLYGLGLDENLLSKLGKHKTGKGCLYFKKLSDVNQQVLENLIEKSVEKIRNKSD